VSTVCNCAYVTSNAAGLDNNDCGGCCHCTAAVHAYVSKPRGSPALVAMLPLLLLLLLVLLPLLILPA
jgi:uncharacterized paraquat-inducible protein A